MTFSKGGVPLSSTAGPLVGKSGRKRPKHYPKSWGRPANEMKMRKRVLCVYDGPRRLWKDEMMLDNEFEVRMRLNAKDNPNAFVTDLDVATLQRAEAIHNATDEEKGPWLQDDDTEVRKIMLGS